MSTGAMFGTMWRRTVRSVDEVREHVGADSLAYISIPGIVQALGFPQDELCLGCVTGKYPVQVPGELDRDGNRTPGEVPAEAAHCC